MRSIAINDADPLIASLWMTVFSEDAKWLAEQVKIIPLTLNEWKRQKAFKPRSTRTRALKCLFLNRTSFNGILEDRAGPIGGWEQKNNTLDCRFNREKLAKRILELSGLRDRVKVCNEGWREFCDRHVSDSQAFFYLDPPYFYKAERLYRHLLDTDGHTELREYLQELKKPWLLSYDDAQGVRELYKSVSKNALVVDTTYSTHPLGGNSYVGRELIFTNLIKMPPPDKDDKPHVGLSVKAGGVKGKPKEEAEPLRLPISSRAKDAASDTAENSMRQPSAG